MNKVIKKYKSWNKIPWGFIQTDILNLQYKIFKHAKRNDIGKVLFYQKKLVNSGHAKLLAVRMITQENKGKKTSGSGFSRI